MVKDGGHAVPDAVQHRGVGAGPGAVQGQMPVDVPPLTIQHLKEIGGGKAVDGQSSCQAGVDVGMGVDEAGHDHAALGVHKFGVRILGFQAGKGADLLDDLTVDHDSAILHIGEGFVAGDEFTVSH